MNLVRPVSQIKLLLLLSFMVTTNGCVVFEQKSTNPVTTRELKPNVWWNEWVYYSYYPTLYNYTVCINATLETGKQLDINTSANQNMKYIIFLDSNIPTVPVGVFLSLTSATELYLNNSGVKSIHPGAFSGMTKLSELYLQENEIETLERGTLNYLSNLQILDLSRNQLRTIEENSLLGLLSLNTLYLGNNSLIKQIFQPLNTLKQLQTLDLSDNGLENFEFDLIEDLKNINTLLLGNNKLQNFTFKTFKNATTLAHLDVSQNNLGIIDFSSIPQSLLFLNFSNNKIKKVEHWTNLHNVYKVDLRRNEIVTINNSLGSEIKILYLAWNKLEFINSSSFINLSSLIELDLSHNVIYKIDRGLFKNLVQLQRLHLNDNKLSFLPIGCFKTLTALKSLNLSQNDFTNFEFGTFTGLGNVEELFLGHNKLTIIHENSFHILERLQTLFLNDNLLSDLNAQVFLQHLKNLKQINLKNNQWTCNVLFKIMKIFQEKSVTVLHGDVHETTNIFGIACKNGEIANHSTNENDIEMTTRSNGVVGLNPNAYNVYSSNMDQFFQTDFLNSSFYKFFSEFERSNFYKFFNEDFNNTNFIEYVVGNNPSNNHKKRFELDEDDVHNAALSDAEENFAVYINQNNELISNFQDLSNRILGFIAIMVSMLILTVLLSIFIFFRLNSRRNYNNNNLIQNEFELN